jgi:hypothetical protein
MTPFDGPNKCSDNGSIALVANGPSSSPEGGGQKSEIAQLLLLEGTLQVTSTTYMDFLLRTGLARLRVVRDARSQYEEDYQQGRDYYRRLREGIIAMHRNGEDPSILHRVVETAPVKKQKNFADCVKGYETWMRGKGIVWSRRPQPTIWKHGELSVLVNPELMMNVDGVPYKVKLYFKPARIKQVGANLVINLHELAGLQSEKVAVLDVRNGRLFTKSRTSADYKTVLESEAQSFAAMWHAVGGQAEERPGGAIS